MAFWNLDRTIGAIAILLIFIFIQQYFDIFNFLVKGITNFFNIGHLSGGNIFWLIIVAIVVYYLYKKFF